jgi:hypothetical protein
MLSGERGVLDVLIREVKYGQAPVGKGLLVLPHRCFAAVRIPMRREAPVPRPSGTARIHAAELGKQPSQP